MQWNENEYQWNSLWSFFEPISDSYNRRYFVFYHYLSVVYPRLSVLETRERNEWASSMNYFIANLYSKIITVASVFSPGRNEKKISNNFRIFAMVYAFISRYKKIIHRKNLKKWLFLLIYQACYPEIYYISPRLYKKKYKKFTSILP